ncbi:MAG: class Ib ribonucleoside-diphosphate reductase assembly flavoprotein NrdI [Alphaproteobacteria bacterium]
MTPLVVYYSSTSGNTNRFVDALGIRAIRIPVSMKAECPVIDEPYVLICPCYADDDGSKAVPKQVIRFLNNPQNRAQMKGVIASGNRNFGEMFAYAGQVISKKCDVPLLYKFELSGTPIDINNVREGMDKLWASLIPPQTLKKTGT